MIIEGRGFAIQAAEDTPWAAWFSLAKLDWASQLKTSPPLFYRHLGEMMAVAPGGVSILWDAQEPCRAGESGLFSAIENALAHLPGLSLHTKKPLVSEQIEAPLNVWLHSREMPSGPLASHWRKGLVGWVPQRRPGWSLPGFGHVPPEDEGCIGSMTWGEIAVLAPALSKLEIGALVLAMEDTQARIEKAMSLRANAGAWPQSIPFQRRQTSWRLALTGGWEFQLSGGSWDELAETVSELKKSLGRQLKCRIQIGVSSDAAIAGTLAGQAMKYGYPWRSSLNLQTAAASFTPGIAADPRKKSPLETRAFLPAALAAQLSDPPVASLRVPTAPSIESIGNFLRGLEATPAIRWLPPGMPPSGPFHPEIPWDPVETFPPIWDGKTEQTKLFEWDG